MVVHSPHLRLLFAILVVIGMSVGRVTPVSAAVTATFGLGILTITGDGLDNTITVGRMVNGTILVNGGAVTISGGPSTVNNTSLIIVFGQDGNDTIALDESNGPLPSAQLFGGIGNDTLTGGSGADQLFGQDGNDTLSGRGGNDQVSGEIGNDRVIWNAGHGDDVIDGGTDNDILEVNGGTGSDTFSVTPASPRFVVSGSAQAAFVLNVGTIESLVVNAGAGDDTFTATNGLALLPLAIVVDGGPGNDLIAGSDGADVIIGGNDNDVITGGRGADVALMGAGDDTFVWNPGDGNDILEGQDGKDTLQFSGANISEIVTLSANGGRLLFTRDIANVLMDVNDVEVVRFNAFGGADTVTINDLAGTDVNLVDINLLNVASTGDGAADRINVNGTTGSDALVVFGSALAGVTVSGLTATVKVSGGEFPTDILSINCQGGADALSPSGLVPGVISLTLTSCESVPIVNLADVTVFGTASSNPIQPGEMLTYSIVLTNNGPGIAASVFLSDTLGGAALPGATTRFVTATTTLGGTCLTPAPGAAGGVVACTWPGSLAPTEARPITMTVQVLGTGTLTNTAVVGSATTESNAANNLAVITTLVATPQPSPTPTAPPTATPTAPPTGVAVFAPVVVVGFGSGW